MKKKKLMLLGGLRYLIPVIKEAHKLNIHVITVDYLPDNIAHRYSDEYHNVNILDKEAILKLAEELKIDGIMSFAVDPGVVTAAYVAEKMNLPFQGSYKSVSILQDKAKFREFLTKNGFKVPKAKGYDNIHTALKEADTWNYPLIVKPVDSAGSKGVTKVNSYRELKNAIETALKESHNNHFIIESFIEPLGFTSDSDSFTVNGKLVVCTFSNQYFDSQAANPFTPSNFSWPSSMPVKYQEELKSELQRLMTLLDMKTGIYNIETRVGEDGNAYIMEVSPRGGGNRLAEMTDLEFDTRLIENSVRNAVGLPIEKIESKETNTYLALVIIHSDSEGIFKSLLISEEIKPYLIQNDLWVRPGEFINPFKAANNSMGTLVFRFPERNQMNALLSDVRKWIKIEME